MLMLASAVTALSVLLVAALLLRYRFADYRSLVYVDQAESERLRASRRASTQIPV